ncbi:B3 DNA binding domain [Musa troglodytarum]|uniref:B3 DNA binding domain n=1 Tax=Musa troglodytarum TaxID=320322 RepID=A0A9E7F550_9LILI|nr:B3 DNA binding domain [Musa troglodytarum]URD87806.1 B3 DNA binding domain [Musa troglodytarum]URD87807.1 B3 DNA binding domain [Musa troglodytarum]
MRKGYFSFYQDYGSSSFEGCEVTAAGQNKSGEMARQRSRSLDRGGGCGVLFNLRLRRPNGDECSCFLPFSSFILPPLSKCSSFPCFSDSSVVLAACSLTSEESNNHPAGHHVSNCSTNGENNHEDDVSSPNPSEPDISDAEEKTVPLSGKPFFSIIMSKSQVQRPYQLIVAEMCSYSFQGASVYQILNAIPKKFWPHLPNTCVPLTLHFKKKIWEMRYYGDRAQRRFDSGWKHFANDNNLKIGDCCFFELMDDKNFTFRVQLLRGDLPAECLNNGLSSDRPILID